MGKQWKQWLTLFFAAPKSLQMVTAAIKDAYFLEGKLDQPRDQPSFNISPSNDYSGLISIRMDCLDPLAVQGTIKSLPQDNSNASIFSAQLYLYYNSHIHT